MRTILRIWCVLLFVAFQPVTNVLAADNLVWRTSENRVDAEISNWDLQTLLGKMANITGWQIYFEPGSTHAVSVKFKNLSQDQALQRLLGEISYSLTQSNGTSQLYVYQTSAKAATQLVKTADKPTKAKKKDYRIPNELVIRLKPNSKLTIDQLASLTNAKILGRDDALRVYRLQFPDEASANAARDLLAKNDSVAWVDSNFSVDRPDPINVATTQTGSKFNLDIKPTTDCSPIVGLIDTAVQPLPGYEKFMATPISVVGDVSTSSDDVPTHGTAMSQAMLQTMTNSSFKIESVVVYTNGGSTSTYEVARGIVKAVNSGANPINLSLGGTGDSGFLRDLIAEASAKGIVFIAAAGNEPVKTDTYPAAFPGVVAVTAADENGHIASYANSGNFVKAMAPGSVIVSDNGQLWQFQGTSVATAYFSGMLAAKGSADCLPVTSQMTQNLISNWPVR